jgi:hypothetical protein
MFVPDRLKTNTFRVLRLSADATLSEIHKAAGAMRRAASLGLADTTEADMPLLGEVARSEADIRSAVGRLENPNQRLTDRLFWFQLPPGLRKTKAPASPSEPNRAALDHDEALRGLFASFKAGFDDVGVPVWVRALRAWHQVVSDDDYWTHVVELEQRGAFEPAAFPSEIDALRDNAVELAAEPLVVAGRDAVARNETSIIRRILAALEDLADTGPWALIAKHDIASPVVERFRALCHAFHEELGSKIVREQDAGDRNKRGCDLELKRFRAEIEPALHRVIQLLPSDHQAARESREDAALCLSGIATDYTWADDFITSEKLREEALMLAHGTLAALRIEDGLEQIRESARKQSAFEIERFRALCHAVREQLGSKIVRQQHAGERNRSICDAELERFRAEIEPALRRVLQLPPSNQEGIQQSLEEAALCLSEIATDHRWADDFVASEQLWEEALRLAHGTPVAIQIGSGLEQIREAGRKQRADGLSADAFVQLCRSIRLECWQKIQPNDSHRDENLAIFKAAFRDYRRQVSPWLAIICDTHRDNTSMLMKARNAAAECLNSVAGGFVCVNDFDTAQVGTLEALPLVLDNDKLEAEIKSQLDYIASEKQKALKSAPRPAPSADRRRPADATSAFRKAGTPRPERAAPSLFQNLWDSRIRLPLILVVGIALLIAIPFLVQVLTDPGRQPSVPHVSVGETAATPHPPTSPDSQPPPVVGSNPVSEVKTISPTPRQTEEMSHEPISLPNGANLIPPQNSEGLGKLKISNYTSSDAAVKLKTSVDRTTVRFVYVRAMNDVTLSKIVPGEYLVQFATGRDWDANDLAFRQDPAFATFDKELSFSERHVDDGEVRKTVYSTHEITLHTVPNGNVQKRAISAEEFSGDTGGGSNGRPKR